MNETSPLTSDQVEIDYLELDKIIEDEFDNDKENLIMILQAVQRFYNYIPRPALAYISEKLDIPLSKLYGVATFYSTFSLEPRGRNIVSICLGTACHVRGGERVHQKIEELLNIDDSETTEDMRFTLEAVRCIGCCSLGPVLKVNEDIHGRITAGEVEKILDQYE